jgi:hypothetical protein
MTNNKKQGIPNMELELAMAIQVAMYKLIDKHHDGGYTKFILAANAAGSDPESRWLNAIRSASKMNRAQRRSQRRVR